MSAQDFLVELGTEELPPKALNTLAEAFLAGIDKGLQAAGLSYESKTVYAAPRRLAVLITALATQQPDRSINLDAAASGRVRRRRQSDSGSPGLRQEVRRRSERNRSERPETALQPEHRRQADREPAADHRRRFAERPADPETHALGCAQGRVRASDPMAGDAAR